MAEHIGNDFATTLAAAITTVGQSSITVASSTGAPSPHFRVRIGDELILVTAVAHPTWTITREIEGTTAATHLNGAAVAHVLSKGGLDAYVGVSGIAHAWERIPAGTTVTVLADRQMLLRGKLRVQGILKAEGSVHII